MLARVQVGGENPVHALFESSYYLAIQPLGTFMMYAPFFVVAWMSASLARVSGSRALGLFLVCAAIFGGMYYSGTTTSQELMKERKWTAATLAIGLIPFKSIPVLLLALIARVLLGRRSQSTKT